MITQQVRHPPSCTIHLLPT